MNVSETEMCDLKRGILIVMREPKTIVISINSQKRLSSRARGRLESETSETVRPATITDHM
jgi:hypothetical protein